jgi:hypothetical protein
MWERPRRRDRFSRIQTQQRQLRNQRGLEWKLLSPIRHPVEANITPSPPIADTPRPARHIENRAIRDTQIIEIRGRHRLIDEILQPGLEVALPIRDRGVDLIVYADLSEHVRTFAARPIQMKASSQESFGLYQKYSRFPNLILAYVWHLAAPARAVTYALTYPEALQIAEAMGWTATSSWIDGGGYSTQAPSAKLIALLEPHRMTSKAWWQEITESI